MQFLRSRLSVAILTLSLAGPVQAKTWIVNAAGGAGVDFLDIPPAVNTATHGDVILVAGGSYTGFTLRKGLTVLGQGTVHVGPGSQVNQVPSGRHAVLADLRFLGLEVRDCMGDVLLDGLTISGPLPGPSVLSVEDSVDVRAHRCTIPAVYRKTGISTSNARLELSECSVAGGRGADGDCGEEGEAGYAGHVISGNARVHSAHTDVTGGQGGINTATCISFCGALSGNGAPAIALTDGELFVSGDPTTTVKGGEAGCGDIGCDGFGAPGIAVDASTSARTSGTSLVGGTSCGIAQEPGVSGAGAHTVAMPDDPSLRVLGTPTVGGIVTFEVTGPPGAAARIFLGRNPVLNPTATTFIEELTTKDRVLNLGPIPASGVVTRNQFVPTILPVGFTFWAQAEVTIVPGGEVRRSNSGSVTVR